MEDQINQCGGLTTYNDQHIGMIKFERKAS